MSCLYLARFGFKEIDLLFCSSIGTPDRPNEKAQSRKGCGAVSPTQFNIRSLPKPEGSVAQGLRRSISHPT